MDLRLDGHVVAIIGGAAGIGLAIAREFAAEGVAVALVDRDAGVVDVAAKIAGSSGGAAAGFVADITDLAAVERAASAIRARFARCDHVVHAAAIGSGKRGFPFWNLEPADWPRVLEVNLVGAVNVAHAFRNLLIESEAGSLLLLASVAGQIGSQTDPPYSASKAGLINFGQCAARDFAPHGVRVNMLCPGMVKTALNRLTYEAWAVQQAGASVPDYEAWAADKIRSLVPLNRWQEPEDIAAMAVFLASPRAKNVTGQTINVDGGFVMHS
jgi:NAD(P)-dependent dehydrogenase (short-subunit alcohol dehydrogenase family)